jgi:predicted nucleic acid-binding protein
LTHVFDTSAIVAQALDEPGAHRVDALLSDPFAATGVSVLTLYEVWTTHFHRTGSNRRADEAVAYLRQAIDEIVSVDESVVVLALALRRDAHSRIALADCLIAATAALNNAILVHRDPHFAALQPGMPAQEILPDRA